jgi:hypothetical protein
MKETERERNIWTERGRERDKKENEGERGN